jgi:hypothetical protein
MSHISLDLVNLYTTYFQKPYQIGEQYQDMSSDQRTFGGQNDTTMMSIPVSKFNDTGVEVYLPIELTDNLGDILKLDCATIRVTFKNTIIRTAVSERKGTIKEQFNSGDYVFTIKGVLIGKDRKMPDGDIFLLKEFATNQTPIYLNQAYAELFMDGNNRIAIESLEFPEQEGKHIRFRPFVMVCETDFIDTLTLD